MSSASDISNLFHILGVSPSNYQEVEKTEQLQGSRGRWPMPAETDPVDIARQNAASRSEAASPAAVVEATAVEPGHASSPAAAPVELEAAPPQELPQPPESSEEAQSAPEQPVVQSACEPAAAQQPAALTSVFARLLERDVAPADGTPRRTS